MGNQKTDTLPFLFNTVLSGIIYLQAMGIGRMTSKVPYLRELTKI